MKFRRLFIFISLLCSLFVSSSVLNETEVVRNVSVVLFEACSLNFEFASTFFSFIFFVVLRNGKMGVNINAIRLSAHVEFNQNDLCLVSNVAIST